MASSSSARPTATIIAYRYSVEVSPLLKNISTYYRDKGWQVLIITDELQRDPSFSVEGVAIAELTTQRHGLAVILRSLAQIPCSTARMFAMSLFIRLMTTRKSSLVFVADFHSLYVAKCAGVPLSRCVYLALENTAVMRHGFTRSYARSLLAKCRMRLVPDTKRADNINTYLDANLTFAVLPVSQRPVVLPTIVEPPRVPPLRLIYSGYFAEWSCLTELLPGVLQCPQPSMTLTLQGHSMGTAAYLEALVALCKGDDRVSFSNEFLADHEHLKFLQSFHVGIACYKLDDIGNFENMLFSSGKIASCLWAGLSVLTNIDAPITREAPFVFLSDWSTDCIRKALEPFTCQETLARYHDAAKALAKRYYNFDREIATLGIDTVAGCAEEPTS